MADSGSPAADGTVQNADGGPPAVVANSEAASVSILGIRVDDVTPEEAIARIDELLRDGGSHQVVTVNPEFVVAAQEDAGFAGVLAAADLAVPDGIGLILASWWLGRRLRARVTGVDLAWRLAALAAQRGYRVYLLGAAPGVAQRAADRLAATCPGMHIAGAYAGSPAAAEEDDLVARIRSAKPHILLVAYGAPAQDKWIARNQARLAIPVAIGVGGTLDYIAGAVPWAPAWMRRLGLEWLYRLIRQPRRWKRIWNAGPRFLWLLFRHEGLRRQRAN
jgi:N-acetylglucosaminyldiphosphoundecaprenol N-acetyl-beta-D-mannosaminyltransferase